MKNQREAQRQAETRWTVIRNYQCQFSCEEAVARLIKIHMEAGGERLYDTEKNEV